MPRFFPFFFAFVVIGAVVLVVIFLTTGPTQNQARSPDEPSRQQNQLPR